METALKNTVWFLGWIIGRVTDLFRFIGGKVKGWFTKKPPQNINLAESFRQRGLYLGPVWFNLFFRPVTSMFAGIIIATILWLPLAIMVSFGLLGQNPIGFNIWILLSLSFAVLIALSDEEEVEDVPEAHAAMLTFLGARLRAYRTEGLYHWTGKRLFLGRSKKVSLPGTDENGFVYLGEIPIRIWNSAEGDDKVTITSVARNSNSVKVTLTIVLKLFDPYLWVDSQDALGDVAERARAAFRTAIAFFVSTDVSGVKSLLGQLMGERTIVTSFLQKNVEMNAVHSLLEDRAGVHQYVIVGEDKDGTSIPDETIDEAKQRFISGLNARRSEFDDKVWEAASDKNGNIIATERSVAEALNEVANAVGADFIRASVGNITLSKQEEDAANEAASEVFQRDSQLKSADTIKEARDRLKPNQDDLDNPYFQDAAMVAAAQDNPNISVVHVTGSGDKMSRAAAVHATQMKKGS